MCKIHCPEINLKSLSMLPNIKCLKQNVTGEPAHPLYQKRSATPIAMDI